MTPAQPLVVFQQARGLFETAIAANPSHAESLGNLAVLLHGQPSGGRAGLDRIEELYKRALHADPANANNFSNYGLFLAEVRVANNKRLIYSQQPGNVFRSGQGR